MNVSKYYQKQYERFVKQTEEKEAFKKNKPETMYTRRKANPRRSWIL